MRAKALRHTTLTLGLELVKHPCVFEGALADFVGLLLVLLDGTLVCTHEPMRTPSVRALMSMSTPTHHKSKIRNHTKSPLRITMQRMRGHDYGVGY